MLEPTKGVAVMTSAAVLSPAWVLTPCNGSPSASFHRSLPPPSTLPASAPFATPHRRLRSVVRASVLAPSSDKVTSGGGGKKEEAKGKRHKKNGGKHGEEQDKEDPARAAVVEDPPAGLGAGPKGADVAAAVEEAVAVVDEVASHTGFEDKTVEAVRAALAEKPRHGKGSMRLVKGVSAAGNNRKEKVVNAIVGWNESIEERYRKDKCAAMAESPFALYRGTAHLFWADFSGDWRMARFGSPKTRTWLVGDMHIYNMGAFLNSKEQVCYGLNDFDESVIGDYQYDVWRLAISLVLTARQNSIRAVDTAAQRDIVLAFGDAYLNTVVAYERKENARTFTKANTSGPLKAFLKDIIKKDETREHMLEKMCNKDYTKFQTDKEKEEQPAKGKEEKAKDKAPKEPKLLPASPEEHTAVAAAFKEQYVKSLVPDIQDRAQKEGWPDDMVLDVAKRVNSGLGSRGMPRYYVLLDHRTNMHKEHHEGKLPIVVDVKLQGGGPRGRPTPFYFMDHNEKAEYKAMFVNEGERHMSACLALTDATDPYLGYVTLPGQGTFSVRERTPVKDSYPALAAEAVNDYKDLLLDSRDKWVALARSWGTILGTLHAQPVHDFDKKMGRFHFRQEVDQLTRHFRTEFGDLLWEVAYGYALQVEQDYLYLKASDLVPDDSRKGK